MKMNRKLAKVVAVIALCGCVFRAKPSEASMLVFSTLLAAKAVPTAVITVEKVWTLLTMGAAACAVITSVAKSNAADMAEKEAERAQESGYVAD